MVDVEKQRISNFIKNMSDDEAQFVIRLLPSKLMRDELSRRERLKSDKLSAISMIMDMEEL